MMFGEGRFCQHCDGAIPAKPTYSKKQWSAVRFCNRHCMRLGIKHDVADRAYAFHSSYVIDKHTGCWIWTKARCEKGYGIFKLFNRGIRAHRASWFFHYKTTIPEGILACHICDNPSCVNPEHLFLGTNQDNSDDKFAKGRAKFSRGASAGRSRLTEEQVTDIFLSNAPATRLAKTLGVCAGTIRAVRQRKTWRHVTSVLPQ